MSKKYDDLVEAVKCVIESYDYMEIREVNFNHKYSICIHDRHVYEGCENCICEFLQKALREGTGD